MFAGNGQAAQGMGMIVFPFTFISSAYVPVSTMPGWLQVFAKHQPLTPWWTPSAPSPSVHDAHRLLGHPTSYYLIRAALWSVGILAVCVPLAIARYRRG